MNPDRIVNVRLYGRQIGTLTLLATDQNFFAFDEDYINDPGRPTLSLSFKSSQGRLLTDLKPSRTRLPPFFSNLLPEGPLREYLARKAGVSDKREFFLIKELGQDLPGAVTIEESMFATSPGDKNIEFDKQMNSSKRTLRFSLAGVQLKFSAVEGAQGGLTIPVEGKGGYWIVKLPSMTYQAVPENEFYMMRLAGDIGMNVPEVNLIPVKEISGLPEDLQNFQGSALAIRRFDREEDGTAAHMEDFAQIFGVYPEQKYQKANYRNIAEVILAESGQEDIKEFIRRLVFSVLIGNGDMHLKNWSLIYTDRRNPRLSPAYDLLSTIPYIKEASTALNLIRNRDMAGFSLERLIHFAAKAKLSENLVVNSAKDTVERFYSVWKNGEYLDDLPFVRDAINEHRTVLKIVKEIKG